MSEWLSQQQLARRIHRTRQQVLNLIAKGLPVYRRGKQPRYDWDVVGPWWEEYLKELGSRKGPTNEDEARARKLAAEAKLAELEVAKAEGELVTIDYFERQLDGILQRLRAPLLAFPGKFAPRLVGLRSVPDAQDALEAAIREVMQGLQDVGEDPSLDEDDEDENTKARA